jgi:hypothetical protein
MKATTRRALLTELIKDPYPFHGLDTQLRTGESIQTDPGFGGFNSKLFVDLRGNAHHKLSAVMFQGYRLGKNFSLLSHIPHYIFNQLPDATKGCLRVFSRPVQAAYLL